MAPGRALLGLFMLAVIISWGDDNGDGRLACPDGWERDGTPCEETPELVAAPVEQHGSGAFGLAWSISGNCTPWARVLFRFDHGAY